MIAATPTSEMKAAIAVPALDLKGTTSRTREIADNAKGVAKRCQEAEKDKADTPESYTGKSINPLRSESHYPQLPPTQRAALGHHPAKEKKTGEVRFGSKPTKLGKTNMLDGKKTSKADHPASMRVAYAPQQSSTSNMDHGEETSASPRFEKNFARSKT